MTPTFDNRCQAKRWQGKAGLFLLGIGLAALVSGCPGPSFTFAEVEGVLTKNGQPLPGVGVYFKPDNEGGTLGPQSMGVTDEAGRYHLRTYKGDVGAVIGRHRVCLVDETGSSSARIPPEYGSTATTPLRDVEVKPGPQTLNFDLK